MLYFKEHIKLKDRNSIWTIKKSIDHITFMTRGGVCLDVSFEQIVLISDGGQITTQKHKKVDSFQNWFFVISDHYWMELHYYIIGEISLRHEF